MISYSQKLFGNEVISNAIIQAAMRRKRSNEGLNNDNIMRKNEKYCGENDNTTIEKSDGFVIIVTCENELYDSGKVTLDYFSENPWEGMLVAVLYIESANDLPMDEYEGLFYQLYRVSDGKRIGYGTINFESIEENIRFYRGKQIAKSLLKSLCKNEVNMVTLKIVEPWGTFPAGTHISTVLQWIETVSGVSVELRWAHEPD